LTTRSATSSSIRSVAMPATVTGSARSEPGEHGEYATVVRADIRQVDLGEDVGDVLLDRTPGDHQTFRDGGIAAPFGHQCQHLAFPSAERAEWIGPPPRHQQLCNDLGVEHRAASTDRSEGIDQ